MLGFFGLISKFAVVVVKKSIKIDIHVLFKYKIVLIDNTKFKGITRRC